MADLVKSKSWDALIEKIGVPSVASCDAKLIELENMITYIQLIKMIQRELEYCRQWDLNVYTHVEFRERDFAHFTTASVAEVKRFCVELVRIGVFELITVDGVNIYRLKRQDVEDVQTE